VVQANLPLRWAEALGGAYNIACGERISLNELVAASRGSWARVKPGYAARRRRHQLSAGGIDKAQRLLGYRPVVSVRDGLRRTWDAL
jgi:UDP-N-acetylglucosamine 4-epimerase